MNKERRPIFQPNELSNDAVVSMRTRIITALVAIAIVLPSVLFGDWAFFILIAVALTFGVIETIRCAKRKYSRVLYITAMILALLVLVWNIIRSLPLDSSWRLFDSYHTIYMSITIIFVGICLAAFTVMIDKGFTVVDACFIFTIVLLIALGFQCILFLRYYPSYKYHLINSDVSYFNKLFREFQGKTPLQYRREIIETDMDSEEQKYANTYITNFTEQYFFDYDRDSAAVEQLLDFVHIHLKINAYDQISYVTKGDITYETFTADKAKKVISKYFAYYFTEEDCKVLPAPPETYGDQPAGPYYEDGKIWYEAADGESYNLIGIVDSVLNNTDGTLTIEFTVYSIDYEEYSTLDMDGIAAYYLLTPEQAAADSTLTQVETGTAVVTIAQSGDYSLISYSTT